MSVPRGTVFVNLQLGGGERVPLIRWHHHLLLAVALVLGACGAEEPLPPDVNPPGFGGSGGTGVDPACDRDGDGEIAAS